MASPVSTPEVVCPNCSTPLSASLRHCTTCQFDAGAPNVRACYSDENLKALTARYEDAKALASAKGCLTEFETLTELIETQSGVVITMSARLAMSAMDDPTWLYTNYERLVGAKARKPASPGNDRHRFGVGGTLFAGYANDIMYGALSLTKEGLPTYGEVYCRLRSVTIDKRTSFLETNSYKFVSEHNISPGDKLPVGHTACWRQRHHLVLAKLAEHLSAGQTEPDWQALLLQSDGKDRNNDVFVEAHIFEGFDKYTIESMVPLTDKLSRGEKLDLKLAISAFNKVNGKTK